MLKEKKLELSIKRREVLFKCTHRGTKELDILISSFVNKIINDLTYDELIQLEKFVNLERSKNEIDRNLEQLRALDSGIQINVALTSSPPLSIDTQ